MILKRDSEILDSGVTIPFYMGVCSFSWSSVELTRQSSGPVFSAQQREN